MAWGVMAGASLWLAVQDKRKQWLSVLLWVLVESQNIWQHSKQEIRSSQYARRRRGLRHRICHQQ